MTDINTSVADPFGTRTTLKPLDFPWAWAAYRKQNAVHWIPDEVPMGPDVADWNQRLTPFQKHLLTQILRFFTQGDVDVAGGYYDRFLPYFRLPEFRMMMGAFAGMEGIHIEAYSLLLEELGFPDVEHQAFAEIKEMADKHDFVTHGFEDLIATFSDVQKKALEIAVFSAFTEGLHLFSSFAILMNFSRATEGSPGLMKGMGQIVAWSIRDESLHVQSMIKVYQAIADRYNVRTPAFSEVLRQICIRMVDLEFRFLELAYEMGGAPTMTLEEAKDYVMFLADYRMEQLGEPPIYGVKEHPLPWLVKLLGGVEHANFFEARSTEYSKVKMGGNWNGGVWGVWAPPAEEAVTEE